MPFDHIDTEYIDIEEKIQLIIDVIQVWKKENNSRNIAFITDVPDTTLDGQWVYVRELTQIPEGKGSIIFIDGRKNKGNYIAINYDLIDEHTELVSNLFKNVFGDDNLLFPDNDVEETIMIRKLPA